MVLLGSAIVFVLTAWGLSHMFHVFTNVCRYLEGYGDGEFRNSEYMRTKGLDVEDGEDLIFWLIIVVVASAAMAAIASVFGTGLLLVALAASVVLNIRWHSALELKAGLKTVTEEKTDV